MMSVKTLRTQDESKRYGKKGGDRSWIVPLVIKLSFMFIFIFVSVNLRVSYNQKTEQLNREAARTKAKIHQLDREIANLKVRREQLSSWPRISSKIAQYRLGLRPAESKQIRRIVLLGAEKQPHSMKKTSTQAEDRQYGMKQ